VIRQGVNAVEKLVEVDILGHSNQGHRHGRRGQASPQTFRFRVKDKTSGKTPRVTLSVWDVRPLQKEARSTPLRLGGEDVTR
jgi:hypothetical protein